MSEFYDLLRDCSLVRVMFHPTYQFHIKLDEVRTQPVDQIQRRVAGAYIV
jgi:hypothetical protein